MKRFNIGENQFIPVSIVLLLAALFIISFNVPAIKRQLNAWKLLPQPERLTELYYENHTALPKTYSPGSEQKFSFTVHNLEYRTITYQYEIAEESEDASAHQILTSGSFTLAHDKYKTTDITISPPDFGPRVKIITSLSKSNTDTTKEIIHYWANRVSEEGV